MSSQKITQILTPVGRLVTGSCFEPSTTNMDGQPLTVKEGPNKGQPRVEYYLGIAIAKTDPKVNELIALIMGEARASFPALFNAQGECLRPDFAFKITDGDSTIPNQKMTRPCDKEGHPGNWIFNFKSGYAPTCYGEGGRTVITDPNAIKRGYYIRVAGTVRGNENAQKPGVYLNLSMVELVAYGEEILSGPDPVAVFGGNPVLSLPQGASNIPLVPQTTPAIPGFAAPQSAPVAQATPTMPVFVAPQATPAFAAPQSAPSFAAPQGVQPAPDFLNPPAPVAPVAVEEKYKASNGVVYTKAQLLSFKWTEAQIATLQKV